MTESTAITLWTPELLSQERFQASEQFKSLKLPALQTILSKADALPLPQKVRNEAATGCDFYKMACYLAHQTENLPVAATMAQAELHDLLSARPELAHHFWVKVDPVNLVPDRDTLLMMPPEQLGITEAESKALLSAFNEHFASEGLELHYGSPQSWYLSVVQAVDLQTTPLPVAVLQPLLAHGPRGNASQYWLGLMNETQMLFFTHEVNERRREKGLPEANGIWIWGEGVLDAEKVVARPGTAIHGESPYLAGIAKVSGAEFHSNLQNPQSWSSKTGHHLLSMDALQSKLSNMSEEEWIETLEAIEKSWLSPLLEAVQQGELASLLCVPGNGKQYHLTPKHLKRFWRFKRPLLKALS
jgi:hypothetical protein